jgi:transcriptional regulator with XRE-family HTH domain
MRNKPQERDFDVQIGKRLRQLRVTRGLSQQTVANALGMVSQQWSKFEKGINRLPANRLQTIADFLEVDVFELLQPNARAPSTPRRMMELGRVAQQLPPDLVDALTQIGRVMLESLSKDDRGDHQPRPDSDQPGV